MRYDVIDLQTKQVVGTRTTRTAARQLADRMDLEYGAIRYTVRGVVRCRACGTEHREERSCSCSQDGYAS